MQYTLLSPFIRANAGHDEKYYQERYTTLDFRGGLFIHPESIWGYGNVVITAGHNIDDGEFRSVMVDKPVRVGAFAWVTSMCILYNCVIGEHAVVGIGSVVANMTVEPWTMVAGNPAKAIKRFNQETREWEKV